MKKYVKQTDGTKMELSKEQQVKERLVLALDVPTLSQAENVVAEVKDFVGVFKIGMQLFTSEGPPVVRMVQERGGKVFLDLKYHDIPNTVAEAGRVAARLGVTLFDVHAIGGKRMMEAVVEAVRDETEKVGLTPPRILAITVLTSLSTAMLQEELGIVKDVKQQVVALARLAQDSGVDGAVASPQELELVRQACGNSFTILTPGIRPVGMGKQDQERVMTPKAAVRAGADYIVVGRAILAANNRTEACRQILLEMANGL